MVAAPMNIENRRWVVSNSEIDCGSSKDEARTISRFCVIIRIKFTKKISNGNAVYNVEDTHTLDNYYEINNYFLLKLIFENFKSKQSDNR